MMLKGKRKSATVYLAAAVFLTCHLTQTIDCYRLKKTERREGRKEAEAAKTIGVREGTIVFGRVFEKGSGLPSQDGTKKSNSSGEDEAAYQADFSGFPQSQTHANSKEATAWGRMAPSLYCGADQLRFRAMGPGASQFAVEQGHAAPMPLSQVPSTCGYNMQRNSLALVMLVPFDGCNMVQEGGNYVLPMRWQGIPVSLLCPKPAAPGQTTAAPHPTTPAMPTTPKKPGMPQYPQYPPMFPPFPMFPYFPSFPVTTTAAPTTTKSTSTTTKSTTTAPPPMFPFPGFPPYPPFPWPYPGFMTTTTPTTTPATTSTTTPATTSTTQPVTSTTAKPQQPPFPFMPIFPFSPSFPLPFFPPPMPYLPQYSAAEPEMTTQTTTPTTTTTTPTTTTTTPTTTTTTTTTTTAKTDPPVTSSQTTHTHLHGHYVPPYPYPYGPPYPLPYPFPPV